MYQFITTLGKLNFVNIFRKHVVQHIFQKSFELSLQFYAITPCNSIKV